MKKLFNFIHRVFGAIKGPAIAQGGDFMEEALEAYYAKKPQQCANLVRSLHDWAPELVELAKKSKTDVDDLSIAEAQGELQEFADRHGIVWSTTTPTPEPGTGTGTDSQPVP